MPLNSSSTPARIQAELNEALSLREAGNHAFRSGDYKLSTEKYRDSNYNILWLKGLRYTGALPADDWTIVETLTEMQFTTQSNEAASWLRYETFDGMEPPVDYGVDFYQPEAPTKSVSRFQKALTCTSMAEDALKDHPTKWRPSAKAMGKLFYRKAMAREGLDDYDGAWKAIQEAHGVLEGNDAAVCDLGTKIWKIRQYGRPHGLERGFTPIEPDFFFKPFRQDNYDRLSCCRLCHPMDFQAGS